MEESTDAQEPGRWLWVVLVSMALVLLGLGSSVALARWFLNPFPKEKPLSSSLIRMPFIQQPPVMTVAEAKLADNAVVIGVSAGGRHRAYLLEAFYPFESHVINDLLGDTPITVAYCDMTDCLAVFTDTTARHPLEVAVGGWLGRSERGTLLGSMLLRIGSLWYRQDNGQAVSNEADPSFPYTRVEGHRTSWKQWRASYPDTDLYIGMPPASQAAH